MARIKGNNLNSPFTGRIGNIVGCKWKDTYYIRMRPASVKHPNTVAQLAQRMRFMKSQEFLLPLKEFLRLGFGAYSSDKSPYNAAMSYTMKNSLTGDYPDIRVDPAMVLVSRGKLGCCENASAQITDLGQIHFSWSMNLPDNSAKTNDRVILVLRSLDDSKAMYKLDAALRSEGSVFLTQSGFKAHTIACYLLFVRPSVLLGGFGEKDISDSIYCGTIQLDE